MSANGVENTDGGGGGCGMEEEEYRGERVADAVAEPC